MSSPTDIEISQSIVTNIQSLSPDADVSSGSVLKDLVADSPATLMGLLGQSVDNISNAQSISQVSRLSDLQVENLAANFLLVRKVPTVSQGFETIFRRTAPPTTINISAGSTITTQRDNTNIIHSFTVLTSGTITSGSYNSTTGLWETTLAVESVGTGTSENVAANTITVCNGLSGVDGCTNRLAFTSGTDKESNAQLALRITTAAQARMLGTAPGYQSLVDAISGVESSIVVTPGNESIRSSAGNEVDVIVMGSDLASATQVEIFNSLNGMCVYLDYTPVSIVATVIGASLNFISGVDYQFVSDTNSENYGSNKALDKIVWLSGGSKPAESESYTIGYSYNKLIGDVQDVIDLPANLLLASDVLVREATEVLVDLAFTVAITSGKNKADAKNEIETAIATYMATLTMAYPLEMSDIDFYLRTQLSYIDRLVLPFTKICRRTAGYGQTDLVSSKYEYFAIDDNSLAVLVI